MGGQGDQGITRERLQDAIETLLFFGPAPSPDLRYLDFEGTVATTGRSKAPHHNRVGMTQVAEEQADALIDAVLNDYRGRGHGIAWYLTPRSRPRDLGERLLARGFGNDPAADMAGMALAPLALDARAAASNVEIRAIDLVELRANVHLMCEGFGIDREAAMSTIDLYQRGTAPGYEFVQVLATEDGVPVGYGTGLVDRHHGVSLLGGSSVLPAHRGRGHYRALVAARMQLARQMGSQAMVTQAVRSTSAPILARLGFLEITAIEKYVMEAPRG